MADLDTSAKGGGRQKKGAGPKTKKKSTKIDMTAMVDVAFLLLTFFVLTATMGKPSVMELAMPPKTDLPPDSTKVKVLEAKILTVILDKNDKIKYYVGITDPEVKTTDFGPEGIRKVLMDHLGREDNRVLCVDRPEYPNCWDPIFIIKPRKISKYKNLVDVLDELSITDAPKYAIDKFTTQDSLLLIGELKPDEDQKKPKK
jgi:hypothetical protein